MLLLSSILEVFFLLCRETLKGKSQNSEPQCLLSFLLSHPRVCLGRSLSLCFHQHSSQVTFPPNFILALFKLDRSEVMHLSTALCESWGKVVAVLL